MKTARTFHNDQEVLVKLSKGFLTTLGFIIIMTALTTVTNIKLSMLRNSDIELRQGFASTADKVKQLDCLSKNIYYEAAKEPFEGKVAVAQVTLNRVESGKFADDICGVVYQRNIFMEKIVCQFSWYCENSSKAKPIYTALYKESEEVAKQVLLENFRLPSLKSALYYHADYINPQWKKTKITQIGHHIFYKEL